MAHLTPPLYLNGLSSIFLSQSRSLSIITTWIHVSLCFLFIKHSQNIYLMIGCIRVGYFRWRFCVHLIIFIVLFLLGNLNEVLLFLIFRGLEGRWWRCDDYCGFFEGNGNRSSDCRSSGRAGCEEDWSTICRKCSENHLFQGVSFELKLTIFTINTK